MFAFERAVSLHRTDLLELDVHASRDGEVMVAHDATLERCTNGTGDLSALSCAELQRLDAGFHTPFRGQGVSMPRLVDVLRAFPSLRINVEVKTAGAVAPFAELVKREGVIDRLCIGSESDELAGQLVDTLPGGCFFYPRDALAAFVLPTKAGEPPDDDGRYTVLDMPYHWEGVQLFDAALAEIARTHGKWINVWTVDDPADMRRAIADGVGGIMTDRPDLLREVLG